METSGGSEPASLHPKFTMDHEFSFSTLVSSVGGGFGGSVFCLGGLRLETAFSDSFPLACSVHLLIHILPS